MSSSVITRFAPSRLPASSILAAGGPLFNWAYAKKTQGKMLLRIEDTDRKALNLEDGRRHP